MRLIAGIPIRRRIHAFHNPRGCRSGGRADRDDRGRRAEGHDRQWRAQRLALQSQHHRGLARQESQHEWERERQRHLRGPRLEDGRRRDDEDSAQSGSRRRLRAEVDRKSTRLNSSHTVISYAVFCLKKKKKKKNRNSKKKKYNK